MNFERTRSSTMHPPQNSFKQHRFLSGSMRCSDLEISMTSISQITWYRKALLCRLRFLAKGAPLLPLAVAMGPRCWAAPAHAAAGCTAAGGVLPLSCSCCCGGPCCWAAAVHAAAGCAAAGGVLSLLHSCCRGGPCCWAAPAHAAAGCTAAGGVLPSLHTCCCGSPC